MTTSHRASVSVVAAVRGLSEAALSAGTGIKTGKAHTGMVFADTDTMAVYAFDRAQVASPTPRPMLPCLASEAQRDCRTNISVTYAPSKNRLHRRAGNCDSVLIEHHSQGGISNA